MLGHHPDPIPRDVDWPALVALCERMGVPAARHGLHLVRSVADLGGGAA